MIRILRLVARPAPWLFGLAVILSIVGGLATTVILVVVLSVLHGGRGSFALASFILLTATAIGGRGAARLLVAAITRRSVAHIRQTLAEAIVATPLADIERVGGVRLRGAMTNDAGRLGTTLPLAVNVMSSLSFIMGCLGYMAWLAPFHFLMLMILIVAGALAYRAAHRGIRSTTERARKIWDDIVTTCGLLVGGQKQIKADDHRRDEILMRLETNSRGSMRAWATHARLSNMAIMGTQSVFYMALGFVIFAPGSVAMRADAILQFGLAIIYMAGPLRELMTTLPEFAEAEVASQRIESVMSALKSADPDAMRLPPSAPGTFADWRQIDLVEVSHSYRTAEAPKFTLTPLSLTLRRGEVVILAGGNGTGKTTLAKLIAGLYVPASGEVRLDGGRLDEADRGGYRHQFAAIFADFVVFETVRPRTEADATDRAQVLLERLDMSAKVQIVDGRFSRTTGLSSGERKRLALLAACVADRPAMLFDEWAADQDPHFKDVFYREIVPELRRMDKLVVIISHDDRYFDVADTVVFLERGMPAQVERRRSPDVLVA